MTGRDDRWWREGEDEPEPDWAERIREGRKARGDRLRDVFSAFGEGEDVDEDQDGEGSA